MSKSSVLDKTVKRYIIDQIDSSSYLENELTTDEEKIRFLRDTFYSEYGWAVPRMGEQDALREWFQGLPSACTPAFCNADIITLAVKWGSLSYNTTEREEQKILDNWFNLLAAKTGQLFRSINHGLH